MTREEFEQLLRSKGIDPGEWKETKSGSIKTPFWEQQKALLEKLKALLEVQVEQDKSKVEELREQLERMKHGGGM